MKNTVLNFSLHQGALPSNQMVALIQTNPRAPSVDANLPAREAAKAALQSGGDFVLVKEQGRLAGLFFPDYVHDLMPDHDVGSNLGLKIDMTLSEMIDRIDEAGIEFHSERVNVFPSLWKCPRGHVTSTDPCPRHNVSTKPYP